MTHCLSPLARPHRARRVADQPPACEPRRRERHVLRYRFERRRVQPRNDLFVCDDKDWGRRKMKRWYLGRFALSCALALALLAGCAADVNGSSPIGLSAVRTRSGSAYRVLYNFGSYPPDGEIPEAG